MEFLMKDLFGWESDPPPRPPRPSRRPSQKRQIRARHPTAPPAPPPPPPRPPIPPPPAPAPAPSPPPPVTAMDLGMAALEQTSARNEHMIRLLAPVAQELAQQAKSQGLDGITTTDLRIAAIERGILTGEEKGKTLSYLGSVMKRAGLTRTDKVRRSTIKATHAIRQTVWTL